MPDFLFVLLYIMFVAFILCSLYCYLIEHKDDFLVIFIICLILLSLIVCWNISYAREPWRYIKTEEVNLQYTPDKSNQFILTQNNNNLVFIDITKKFAKIFPENSVMIVKHRDMGFYIGVKPIPDYEFYNYEITLKDAKQ